jgi:hypothetical protein
MLTKLSTLDIADNYLGGTIPDSIGQLISLKKLYLGYEEPEDNIFVGPLPSSMSKLVLLEKLYLNVPTLTGAIPDLSRLIKLGDCSVKHSSLCRISDFVPVPNSRCDFGILPVCVLDCKILAEWLPDMFDLNTCCQVDGVTCEDDRLVILDLSKASTGRNIAGAIPSFVNELAMLRELYLQNNFLEGNLPASLSTISALQIVDITNNFLSGVIPFLPTFDLIGVDSNPELSLPSESPLETQEPDVSSNVSESSSVALIIGITLTVLLIILVPGIAVLILLKRRKQGKETDIELKLLPKYSSPNKQIRLMRKINSGGFGVAWEARYKGETVAMKLIRIDKYEGRDNARKLKLIKMVTDESLIMELMVHKRIVRFIKFEIESLGIVLEYLPIGSLDMYILQRDGVMSWTDRYQMMLDICEGMEFLHSNVYANGSTKKVLFHQDLKSGNVLLCMQGSPRALRGKISDFGLSCKFLYRLHPF